VSTFICDLADILPNSGVCALVEGKQVALFRVDDEVFAIDNRDPATGVNVLSRGIVGDVRGELVVASPLYKHHYSLITGLCVEDSALSVNTYDVRIEEGRVWVQGLKRRAQRRRLVVVGNGMAGMRTVEELLELAPDTYEIVVFGAEPHGNYNRILLSPLLAGEKSTAEILIHPPEWYAQNRVTLHAGDPVVSIDRRKRIVKSQQGREVSYDRLLLATGSKPLILPLPGKDLPGVVTFRDIADVETMLEAARNYRKAVVIGGGLLGLEAANGLLRRGMDVTVVHIFDSLMERQLDDAAAALLKASLEARGMHFRMSAKTTAILGDQRVAGIRFDDGSELDADLVVMAAGVRPNIDLAQAAGIQCQRGVLVTDTMQTFDPSIYAVGECVQHRNSTFGLVAPLWDQARVCAAHLAEKGVTHYRGTLPATQLKVTGIDLYSAGDFLGSEGDETLVLRDTQRGIYKRIVIRNNQVRGAVLYGDATDSAWYFDLMARSHDIAPLRDALLFGPAFAAPEQ
jgi:NAD(P)H-dependent nitrite reductase large subunit/NAD(P)H-dependent nitrite reductase small subunit